MTEIEADGYITREVDLRKSEAKQEPAILIKGMEMPENCNQCRLKDAYYLECNVMHKRIGTYVSLDQKPAWCPLAEIGER
jgi:hypothetical protein